MVLLETPESVFVDIRIPKVFVSTKPLSKFMPKTITTTTTTMTTIPILNTNLLTDLELIWT